MVSAVLPEGGGPAAYTTAWATAPYSDPRLFDEQDRLNPTDPVYSIPPQKREEMMTYFASKPGF